MSEFATVTVPVRCTASFPTGMPCEREQVDHVHTPPPCENGQDERHHDFQAPQYVVVRVGDEPRTRRLKVRAA